MSPHDDSGSDATCTILCRAMNDETVKATTKTSVIILGGGALAPSIPHYSALMPPRMCQSTAATI